MYSGAGGGGGGMSPGGWSMNFGGNVDSAFATAVMKLIRNGQIKIARKAVVG